MQATFQINHSDTGALIVRDAETGEQVSRVQSETRIDASTDSWSVVGECDLPGKVLNVEHDKDSIVVTAELPAAMCDPQCTND